MNKMRSLLNRSSEESEGGLKNPTESLKVMYHVLECQLMVGQCVVGKHVVRTTRSHEVNNK